MRAASPAGERSATPETPRAGTFFYDPNRHDDNSKLVLGVPIAAGGGFNDGLNVLNILSTHPSTARFISRKLLRWLLNYDPSPALVADIAGEFTRTGGDIKSIVRRILHYDNVLWSPPLFKRPFHYIVSALRVMNANITSLIRCARPTSAGTGHTPFAWGPPDGYPQEFEYWGGLPLPRWNFAFQLANNSVSGAAVDLTALLAGANSAAQIADRIDALCSPARCRPPTRRRSSRICARAGPRPCRRRPRFVTLSAWRWHRRPFSGTDAKARWLSAV